MTKKYLARDPDEEIWKAFKLFDEEGSGRITVRVRAPRTLQHAPERYVLRTLRHAPASACLDLTRLCLSLPVAARLCGSPRTCGL